MKSALTPIVVDLDETLARTDFFYESLLKFIKQNPLNFFRAVFILFTQGKAFLKTRICEAVNINAGLIPYNQQLIDWLKQKKQAGHKIVLATATHQKIAEQVGRHVGIFDQILATNEQLNLKGSNKEKKLIELFGEKEFVYVGDSVADLKVWRSAKSAVVINPTDKLLQKVKSIVEVDRVFAQPKHPQEIFKAIRIHQWVKNLLVFVPLFTSHNFGNLELLIKAAIAFFAFSFCASSVYVINDFFDLEDDREHRTKRNRPFASGQITILRGLAIAFCCLLVAFVLSFYLGAAFLAVVATYFLITLLYSLFLKSKPVLDILVLAGLYTIRIAAGAIAIEVELSFWLFAYSMFIFLSLAIMKRYTELYGIKQTGEITTLKSRGYSVQQMKIMALIGSVSGFISVLIMALFVNSLKESNLYLNPNLLWYVCPLLLFWIARIWLLAVKGQVDDDPIHFVIKDKTSWLLGIIIIVIFVMASD